MSRNQILGCERGLFFSVQLFTSRIGNLTRLMHMKANYETYLLLILIFYHRTIEKSYSFNYYSSCMSNAAGSSHASLPLVGSSRFSIVQLSNFASAALQVEVSRTITARVPRVPEENQADVSIMIHSLSAVDRSMSMSMQPLSLQTSSFGGLYIVGTTVITFRYSTLAWPTL